MTVRGDLPTVLAEKFAEVEQRVEVHRIHYIVNELLVGVQVLVQQLLSNNGAGLLGHGCQMGVRWVSDGCQRSVRWVSDGCHNTMVQACWAIRVRVGFGVGVISGIRFRISARGRGRRAGVDGGRWAVGSRR